MSYTLNLTTGNPTLAELEIVNCKKDWLNLTVANLAPKDAEFLKAFAEKVFDVETLEQEQGVVSAKYGNGRFERLRPPSVMQKDGKLVTKLGRDIFELNFEQVDVAIKTKKLNKYEDLCLVLTYEYEEDEYAEWPLPLSIQKEHFEKVDENKISGWVKKGNFDKLAAILYEAKEAGSGAGNYDAPMVKLDHFELGTPYKVLFARPVNASYGQSWILHLETTEGEVQCWAPYNVKNFLNLGAVARPDATLTVAETYIKQDGEIGYVVDITGFERPVDENSAKLAALY